MGCRDCNIEKFEAIFKITAKPPSSLQSKLLPISTLILNFDTSTASANITWISPQTQTNNFSLLIYEVNADALKVSTTATHEVR